MEGPRYTVYYRASVQAPISLSQMRRNGQMLDLLRQRGFSCENVNVGHDPALQARVAAAAGRSGKVEEDWPIAETPTGAMLVDVGALERHLEEPKPSLPKGGDMRTSPVPSLEDSRVLDMRLSVLGDQFRKRADLNDESSSGTESSSLEGSLHSSALLAAQPETPPSHAVLGSVDSALEGLEWAVVKGYGWVAGLVSPVQSGAEPAEEQSDPDFEVVQTNWYGRSQKRHLRVTRDALLRVHPMTGEVRKRVALADVTAVRVQSDGTHFSVIVGGDTATAEAYQSLYVPQLLRALKRHGPHIEIQSDA